MAKGNGRREQAGNGKTVHYLSRTGNKAAKRATSKAVRQGDKRAMRKGGDGAMGRGWAHGNDEAQHPFDDEGRGAEW